MERTIKVTVIADENGKLGEVIATCTAAEAASGPWGDGDGFGVAFVDDQAGTIDWGHAVTRIGEPMPQVVIE